jgi:predicted nucleotidyltransferase
MKTSTTQVDLLDEIVRRLLEVDGAIRSVVLIGSFAWFPDLARDIDIVVITESDLPTDAYWEAVADFPKPVDVIVLRRGEKAKGLVLALRTGVLLWGDEGAIKEATENMPVPTFEQARRVADRARHYFQMGLNASDPVDRDMDIRNAFNALFDAARMAAMCFLDTEETRWGELRRQLPPPFNEQFRRIIDALHVAYFYGGHYPAENIAETFERWHREVSAFIEGLRQRKELEQP